MNIKFIDDENSTYNLMKAREKTKKETERKETEKKSFKIGDAFGKEKFTQGFGQLKDIKNARQKTSAAREKVSELEKKREEQLNKIRDLINKKKQEKK